MDEIAYMGMDLATSDDRTVVCVHAAGHTAALYTMMYGPGNVVGNGLLPANKAPLPPDTMTRQRRRAEARASR